MLSLLLIAGQFGTLPPVAEPLKFTEYGFPWEQRLGTNYGLGSPFGGTITRYSSSGFPDAPTGRRIGLDAEISSCGLKLSKPLGYGDYEVLLAFNASALDPNINVGVWLYDDTRLDGGDEIDAEFSKWGDTNNPFGVHLGVISRQKRFGDVAKFHTGSAGYWRIKLHWWKDFQAINVDCWQVNHAPTWDKTTATTTVVKSPGKWTNVATGSWQCSAGVKDPAANATLRIAIAQNCPHMYAPAHRVRSKIIVAGVKFTPIVEGQF